MKGILLTVSMIFCSILVTAQKVDTTVYKWKVEDYNFGTIEGYYVDSLPEGIWVQRDGKGRIRFICNLVGGNFNGLCHRYDETGSFQRSEFYLNGRLVEVINSKEIKGYSQVNGFTNGNGSIIDFDVEGDTSRVFQYKNGLLDGVCLFYGRNNKLEKSYNYVDGKINGECILYGRNRRIIKKYNVQDGRYNGQTTLYRKNGSVKSVINFKDGLPIK